MRIGILKDMILQDMKSAQAEENYQIMLNESDRIEFMSDLIEQIIDEPREQRSNNFSSGPEINKTQKQ